MGRIGTVIGGIVFFLLVLGGPLHAQSVVTVVITGDPAAESAQPDPVAEPPVLDVEPTPVVIEDPAAAQAGSASASGPFEGPRILVPIVVAGALLGALLPLPRRRVAFR